MKYLIAILLFIISAYLFVLLNINFNLFIQPFLIALLLLYFNSYDYILNYSFALLSGLFIDSITTVFGLHTIIFLAIIFIISSLQLNIFRSKDILSVILLTLFSFIIFWLLFISFNFIFNLELYTFNNIFLLIVLKSIVLNIILVILSHLLFFNFWFKKHGK